MTPERLLAKARQAAASARVLLGTGDHDGACNRAYYAMFDAARAALLASGSPVEAEIIRTHNEAVEKLCSFAHSAVNQTGYQVS